ncbi:MAG: TolC family protein, partial [Rhodoferax sp.]|nr:TolC family protein [Rhodoferax sp.]
STLNWNTASLDSRLQHHPQIALMVKQEEVARAAVDIAQSNTRSDWSVELMFNQRGSAYANMVSLNLSIPFQFDPKNRQDREVSAKLAVVEQLRAEREEATREDLAQIRIWLQQWQSNRDRLEHYDGAQIPLAADRTRAALAAYRGGSGSLTAVLEARRMEIEASLDRLRLEMETASLWARLEYLIPTQQLAAGDGPALSPEPIATK